MLDMSDIPTWTPRVGGVVLLIGFQSEKTQSILQEPQLGVPTPGVFAGTAFRPWATQEKIAAGQVASPGESVMFEVRGQ